MKQYKYILAAITATLLLGSCDDDKMEWGRPGDYGDVSVSEIPLQMAEQIANYDFIKAYATQYMPGSTIGLGLDAGLYINNDEYRQIADDNFQVYTMGNEMKHSSVVNSGGVMNFNTIDRFFNTVPASISIYGHTLVWHSQQQSAYLNNLIAPKVILPPGGSNLLNTSGLADGTFNGWSKSNNASGITFAAGEGMGDNTDAIRFDTSTGSGSEWNTQLGSPNLTVVDGNQYEVSFYVRAEAPGGEIRLSFTNMSDGYPWVNGGSLVPVGTDWTLVRYNSTTIGDPFTAAAGSIAFNFDMGKTADMVYYVDISTLRIVDLDVEDGPANLVDLGGLKDGSFNGWANSNNAVGMTLASGDGMDGADAIRFDTSTGSGNEWDTQLGSPSINVTEGNQLDISFYIRAEAPGGQIRLSFSNMSNEYPWVNGGSLVTVGTDWTLVRYSTETIGSAFTATAGTMAFNFDMGKTADMVYYIDINSIKVIDLDATEAPPAGPIEIPKTDEEKKEIITEAMTTWITTMVEHCKDRVGMWDVMNEIVTDGGALRGVEQLPAEIESSEFYWGQYIGKEYGVLAFQTARAADPNAKLFINDYNLEINPGKLAKIIEYVKWIDQENGSPIVDGLATQMHLIANTITRDQIDAMFKTMAATGKLVRVTELDVRLGTASPTLEQLERQLEVYRWVGESYNENVPDAQKSGITVWTLSDAEEEHVYWYPSESPNLFDADYNRKYAYKGFCDGIAGKDIGSEFSGENWEAAYPSEE